MSKRILLVEDQADNRKIIRDMLRGIDYEIVEAENGEEALAAPRLLRSRLMRSAAKKKRRGQRAATIMCRNLSARANCWRKFVSTCNRSWHDRCCGACGSAERMLNVPPRVG